MSDTAFYVTDTIEAGEGPLGFRTVNVTSDLAACFTVDDTVAWLNAVPTEGCTPSQVTISYDATGLAEGVNYGYVMITGDSTVCESRIRYIPFILNLVDTSGTPVNGGDTLTVRIANAVPGAKADVSIDFVNQCTLTQLNLMLTWPDGLYLDSISTTGRLSDFNWNTHLQRLQFRQP